MPTVAELRKRIPGLDHLDDYELADIYARGEGISPELAQRELGIAPKDAPGFKSSIDAAVGHSVRGLGQIATDLGAEEIGGAISRYGRNVVARNPESVQGFEDFAKSPWQGFKEAVGSAVGSIGPQMALMGAGGAIGMIPHPLAQVAGRGLQALGAGTIFAPEYGGIRDKQKELGTGDDLLAATAGAAVNTAVETALGPQRLLASLLKRGVARTTAEQMVAREFAASPWKTAAKTAVRMPLEEASEELIQNPVSDIAAGDDPLSRQNLQETAFGAFKAGVGTLPLGGAHGVRRGLQHSAIGQSLADNPDPSQNYLPPGTRDPQMLLQGMANRQADQAQAEFDMPGGEPLAPGATTTTQPEEPGPEVIHIRRVNELADKFLKFNPAIEPAVALAKAESIIVEKEKADEAAALVKAQAAAREKIDDDLGPDAPQELRLAAYEVAGLPPPETKVKKEAAPKGPTKAEVKQQERATIASQLTTQLTKLAEDGVVSPAQLVEDTTLLKANKIGQVQKRVAKYLKEKTVAAEQAKGDLNQKGAVNGNVGAAVPAGAQTGQAQDVQGAQAGSTEATKAAYQNAEGEVVELPATPPPPKPTNVQELTPYKAAITGWLVSALKPEEMQALSAVHSVESGSEGAAAPLTEDGLAQEQTSLRAAAHVLSQKTGKTVSYETVRTRLKAAENKIEAAAVTAGFDMDTARQLLGMASSADILDVATVSPEAAAQAGLSVKHGVRGEKVVTAPSDDFEAAGAAEEEQSTSEGRKTDREVDVEEPAAEDAVADAVVAAPEGELQVTDTDYAGRQLREVDRQEAIEEWKERDGTDLPAQFVTQWTKMWVALMDKQITPVAFHNNYLRLTKDVDAYVAGQKTAFEGTTNERQTEQKPVSDASVGESSNKTPPAKAARKPKPAAAAVQTPKAAAPAKAGKVPTVGKAGEKAPPKKTKAQAKAEKEAAAAAAAEAEYEAAWNALADAQGLPAWKALTHMERASLRGATTESAQTDAADAIAVKYAADRVVEPVSAPAPVADATSVEEYRAEQRRLAKEELEKKASKVSPKGQATFMTEAGGFRSGNVVVHPHGVFVSATAGPLNTYQLRSPDGETLVGYMTLKTDSNGIPIGLHDVTVFRRFRKQRWGEKAVAAILDIAPDNTIYVDNIQPNAVKWWQRMGTRLMEGETNWEYGNGVLTQENYVASEAAARGSFEAAPAREEPSAESTAAGTGFYEAAEDLDFTKPKPAKTIYGFPVTNRQKILSALHGWFFTEDDLKNKVTIVDTWDDLSDADKASFNNSAPGGVAHGEFSVAAFYDPKTGRATFIADRIPQGEERSMFMHEIGAHLGLSSKEEAALARSARMWQYAPAGSMERSIYNRTIRSMEAAKETSDAEFIAYATQHAVDLGMRPTMLNRIGRWLRDVADRIMQRIGMNVAMGRALTAQDLVDYTYGAAKLALNAQPHEIVRTENNPLKDALNPKQWDLDLQRSVVVDTAARLGGRTAEMLADNATHTVSKMVYGMASLHDLVDEFKSRLPAVTDWYKAVQDSIAMRKQLEQQAEKVAGAAEKLPNGTTRVNEFLSKSTFEQKWGYDPKFGRQVVVDPEMASAFNRLSPAEQAVVKQVFQHGEDMITLKNKLLKDLGIDNVFDRGGKLKGPYAPLKRFGDYIAVLKSKELADLQDIEQPTAEQRKRIEELRSDPAQYVVSYFDTIGQAKQFVKENRKGFDVGYAFEKGERVHEGHTIKPKVLERVLSALRMSNVTPAAKEAMAKTIQDMYFQSLDEYNARTTGLRRRNRAGYDADMMRSFLSQARAEASYLANMRHGGDINDAFYRMQQSVGREKESQHEFNMIAKHYAEHLTYKETPWQDRAMALTSAWQLATSIGYHLQNLMQPIMVTIPKLGADFNNYGGAWSALMKGYDVLKATGVTGNIDLTKVKDEGLRAALQRAADMGVLDVGMEEDLTQFESIRSGIRVVDGASTAARTALHKLRQVSRAVETANRVASATAGYNMARAKGQTVEQAQEYAVRILQTTQGDFSRLGAPLLLKKLPKAMTQYRKYQFMMMALYAKAYRDAFHGATPEVRAIGRRMLAYKLFHTSMAAGVLGWPLMNVAALVFSALAPGGDDEPKDLERSLRELIGDEDLARLLLHGPMAYLGLDLGPAKLGEDKIFSIMPYGEWDFTSKEGVAKTALGLAGPAASQAGKFGAGFGDMAKGDYYKGLEKFMPKGVESAMRAFRVANEGYTLKNGDVMFKPEDISGFSMALEAMSIPTTEYKNMTWLRGQQYVITKFYKERTTEIEHDYAKATKEGDSAAMADLREEWMNLQASKDNMRRYFGDSHSELKRQPLSNLLKYPQIVQKRERKLQAAASLH